MYCFLYAVAIRPPLTFARGALGTFGPALRAGEAKFPSAKTEIPGLLMCGDSVFPGLCHITIYTSVLSPPFINCQGEAEQFQIVNYELKFSYIAHTELLKNHTFILFARWNYIYRDWSSCSRSIWRQCSQFHRIGL